MSIGGDFKIRTRSFILPGQEAQIDAIHDNDLYTVTQKIVTPMPKEGIIMVYMEYEDHSKEE